MVGLWRNRLVQSAVLTVVVGAGAGFFCASALAQPGSAGAPVPAPDGTANTEIPRLKLDTYTKVHPGLLSGNELEVFKVVSGANQANPITSGAGNQPVATPPALLVIKPVFLPQWRRFSDAVSKACASAKDSDSRTVNFEVEFWSALLLQQVVDEVNTTMGTKFIPGNVYVYPYYSLVLTTHQLNKGDWTRSNIQWPFPSGLDSFERAVPGGLHQELPYDVGHGPSELTPTIAAPCNELRRIAAEKTVSAWLISQRVEGRANIYTASLDFTSTMADLLELNRTEDASGVLRTSSSANGSGFGFNLSALHVSDTSHSVSTTVADSRRRYVSSNLIQDALQLYASHAKVYARREKAAAGASDPVASLLDVLKAQLESSPKIGILTPIENNHIQIKLGEINRALSEEDVHELMSSAPDASLDTTDKVSASCGQGATCTVDSSGKGVWKDDVRWDRTAKGLWIPTAAKLHMVDLDRLQALSSFVVVDADVTVADLPDVVLLGPAPANAEPPPNLDTMLNERDGVLRAMIVAPPKTVFADPAGLIALRAIQLSDGAVVKTAACADFPAVPATGFVKVSTAEVTHVYLEWPAGHNLPSSPSESGVAAEVDAAQSCVRTRHNNFASYCAVAGRSCQTVYVAQSCSVNVEWLDWYRKRQRLAGLPEAVSDACHLPVPPASVVSAATHAL